MERDSAGMKGAGPHPIQVRLAFGGDAEHRPEFAELVSSEGNQIVLRMLRHSGLRSFAVTPSERLLTALARTDVCRWEGKGAFVAVNPHYHVLAVAVGPGVLPRHIEMNYGVVRLDNGVAVEMPSDAPDQPSWCVVGAHEAAPQEEQLKGSPR